MGLMFLMQMMDKGGTLWPLKGSVLFLLLQVCGWGGSCRRGQGIQRPWNAWVLKAEKLHPQGPQLGGNNSRQGQPGGRAGISASLRGGAALEERALQVEAWRNDPPGIRPGRLHKDRGAVKALGPALEAEDTGLSLSLPSTGLGPPRHAVPRGADPGRL